MKRTAMIVAMLASAALCVAQYTDKPAQQNPPAGQSGAAPAGAPAQTPPAGKRPLQAKTQPEYDAYKAAAALTDPVAFEKAADDFAAKFPDSELRGMLYKNSMHLYQSANNADKTLEVGRKVLQIDGDDPEALVVVANVLAERTRDTDLDKDQRLDEAMKMAQRATQTADTDVNVPAGTPQERVDAYKGLLRSNAYSVIGTLKFKKEDYVGAEGDLRKSIEAYPSQPDPVVVLRLALALDKQGKYPEALKEANRAVELTQDGTQVGTLSRRERDRLVQLTGGSAPAPGAKPTGPAASTNPPAQNPPPKN